MAKPEYRKQTHSKLPFLLVSAFDIFSRTREIPRKDILACCGTFLVVILACPYTHGKLSSKLGQLGVCDPKILTNNSRQLTDSKSRSLSRSCSTFATVLPCPQVFHISALSHGLEARLHCQQGHVPMQTESRPNGFVGSHVLHLGTMAI